MAFNTRSPEPHETLIQHWVYAKTQTTSAKTNYRCSDKMMEVQHYSLLQLAGFVWRGGQGSE